MQYLKTVSQEYAVLEKKQEHINMRILKGYLWYDLLSGCECWTTDKETMKTLKAVQNVVYKKLYDYVMKGKENKY